MSQKRKIRVMIAEDMEPIRRRYKKILNETDDIEVVCDVGTGQEAISSVELAAKEDEKNGDPDHVTAESRYPDVILMDIEMETSDAGLKATQAILSAHPNIRVIILTVYEEDELILTAFQVGVIDYINKNAKPEDLFNSIRDAYRGKSSLRPELTAKILGEYRRVRNYETSFLYATNLVASLSPTELEILSMLTQGMSRAEICRVRHVEMSTIKTQIKDILRKFNKPTVKAVLATIEELQLGKLLFGEK